MKHRWCEIPRSEPCPICGHKGGWCTIREDRAFVHCKRLQNSEPIKGRSGDVAWRYRLDGAIAAKVVISKPRESVTRSPDEWLKLASRFRINAKSRNVERFASSLGLTVASLDRLRIGWVSARELKDLDTACKSTGAWTFAMRNAAGKIVGIRLRTPDGFKYAVNGSNQGLFIPAGLVPIYGDLHAVEGPTSLAALLDLGFSAIGRPSCSGGGELVAQFVKLMKLPSVIVWGDRDDAKPLPGGKVFYPGQEGAKSLALSLGRVARVFIPPVKDARDWLRRGATRDTVERAIGPRRTA